MSDKFFQTLNDELNKLDHRITNFETWEPYKGIQCQGRLSLSTTAIPTSNITAATNLYFVPWGGRYIDIYDGSKYKTYKASLDTISLTGLSANTIYDVFVYDNNGSLTYELVAWASSVARATDLIYFNGDYLKTGELNKRYLGTIRTTAVAGQCEDSLINRFVNNLYNQVTRPLIIQITDGGWVYAVNAWRAANNKATWSVNFVSGLATKPTEIACYGQCFIAAGADNGYVGVGLDATNVNSAQMVNGGGSGTNIVPISAKYLGFTGIGFHTLYAIESTQVGGVAVSFYGNAGLVNLLQAGLIGYVWG